MEWGGIDIYTHEKTTMGIIIAVIALLVVLPIALLIASAPILDEGVVVAKYHEEASTTYMYRKIGNVHQMVPIRDDEDWVLEVRGTTEKGKERTERWEVPEETWNRAEIGDTVYEGMRR